MASYENAVITKARAMYGRMLSPAQYDELLRKQSVQEIAAYLKEKTSYADALASVQESAVHRGQLERLLHKDMLYQFVRLARYIRREEGTYGYVILKIEIEAILACLRCIISGRGEKEFIAQMPDFIQPYVHFDVSGLARVRSVEQLAEALRGTLYGPILQKCLQAHPARGGMPPDYTVYEVAMRDFYSRTLLDLAEKSTKGEALRQLRELITLRAETINLSTIYRMKAFFHAPPERIRQAMHPFYCKLSARKLDALIETKDARAFMQALLATPYGKFVDPNSRFIEAGLDRLRIRLDLRFLRFSTDPQVVFMSFMLLRGMETENIVRIIEGVRYQRAPEKIERLLCRP